MLSTENHSTATKLFTTVEEGGTEKLVTKNYAEHDYCIPYYTTPILCMYDCIYIHTHIYIYINQESLYRSTGIFAQTQLRYSQFIVPWTQRPGNSSIHWDIVVMFLIPSSYSILNITRVIQTNY